MVEYTPAGPDDEGIVYLRDPLAGRLGGADVLLGVAVTEDGTPITGEHSSQRFVRADLVTGRTPLRLDPDRGLVVAKAAR